MARKYRGGKNQGVGVHQVTINDDTEDALTLHLTITDHQRNLLGSMIQEGQSFDDRGESKFSPDTFKIGKFVIENCVQDWDMQGDVGPEPFTAQKAMSDLDIAEISALGWRVISKITRASKNSTTSEA